ncbi:hypothetical protein [Dactylosporangium matsuzakiense]|uniref:hypothetical protein n=1 Tax=Dactylosporangium matsuzakiense TaxID=53360 RepID=UPI0021C332A3|nr:hypothetical protein [Dactylosporangium matsuzakiense]UWZ44694.1 hypothetical protein Dmats_46465 [Dactylosporangium matsuzakiense]
MTGRPRPRARVFAQLLVAWGLPEPDQMRGNQLTASALYYGDGLRREVWIMHPPGQLQWGVQVRDDALSLMAGRGFCAEFQGDDEWTVVDGQRRYVADRRIYPWPTGREPLDRRLVEDGRRYVPAMLWMLHDRAELGRLLLAGHGSGEGVWERDGLLASPQGAAEARIVQAVILARTTGDTALESAALAKLRTSASITSGQSDWTFAEWVGHFAAEDQQWCTVDITDLTGLQR